MARYIDADKLIFNDITDLHGDTFMVVHAPDVTNAPTEDVQPIKRGHWIDTEPEYNYERHCSAHYQCSECGRRTGIRQTRTYKYCPKCGAKMDETVDKRVKEHPVKTYAQDFFEKFPNAAKATEGRPGFCRIFIYGDEIECPEGGCEECWNQEMKYNG